MLRQASKQKAGELQILVSGQMSETESTVFPQIIAWAFIYL